MSHNCGLYYYQRTAMMFSGIQRDILKRKQIMFTVRI